MERIKKKKLFINKLYKKYIVIAITLIMCMPFNILYAATNTQRFTIASYGGATQTWEASNSYIYNRISIELDTIYSGTLTLNYSKNGADDRTNANNWCILVEGAVLTSVTSSQVTIKLYSEKHINIYMIYQQNNASNFRFPFYSFNTAISETQDTTQMFIKRIDAKLAGTNVKLDNVNGYLNSINNNTNLINTTNSRLQSIIGLLEYIEDDVDELETKLDYCYNQLTSILNALNTIVNKLDTIINLIGEANNENNYNDLDTIYCGISQEISLPNSSTWKNINYWYQLSQVGTGFTLVNGDIKVNYDGYVMIWNRIYTDTSTNAGNVSASYQVGGRWLLNDEEIPNSYYNQSSLKWTQLNNICMTEVKKGDLLRFQARFVGVPGYIYANSNCIIQYLPKQIDYGAFFQEIINNQTEQTIILNSIYEYMGNIKIVNQPNSETVNNTINNYNNDIDIVNNITTQFNDSYVSNKDNLDFTPLQIGDGLRNASNLYTHIFEGLITNDYMKGVFTLAMLIGIVILIFK